MSPRISRARHRATAFAGAGLIAVAIAACGGQSASEKAQSQVCDARASIQQQVNTLKSLPLSTSSINQAKQSLQTIQSDLKQIADAQGQLSSDRKAQVQQATKTFTEQVQNAVTSAVNAGSTSDVKGTVNTALKQLETSFKQTLQPIDCSGS